MSASLDLRGAVREANTIFRRYPARISLPMIVLGLLSYAATAPLQSGANHPIFIALLVAFVAWLLSCYAEVGVASMYLLARDGGEPGGEQLLDALHYRGFAAVLWGLLLRYSGWGLLLGLVTVILAVFVGLFAAGLSAGSSGIGAFADGIGAGGISESIGAILGAALATFILYRYIFVFPMFAIARDSGSGFLADCIERTRRVWKTAVLVLMASTFPAVLALMEPLIWRHLSPPHALRIAIELAAEVVSSCYAAWLIGIRTGLALQLASAKPVPTPQLPTESSGNQLPDGLVS